MTEAQLILLIVNGAVVFLAASLFVKFLCDEYLRMLAFYGLIRPPAPADATASPTSASPRSAGRKPS